MYQVCLKLCQMPDIPELWWKIHTFVTHIFSHKLTNIYKQIIYVLISKIIKHLYLIIYFLVQLKIKVTFKFRDHSFKTLVVSSKSLLFFRENY